MNEYTTIDELKDFFNTDNEEVLNALQHWIINTYEYIPSKDDTGVYLYDTQLKQYDCYVAVKDIVIKVISWLQDKFEYCDTDNKEYIDFITYDFILLSNFYWRG